jgi:hypothetical protein
MITQRIVFADAQCGPKHIVVIFFRQGHQRCSWTEFEKKGPEAMAAVVAAKWNCNRLQNLAKSFENKEISISETECALREERKDAERRKTRESLWIKSSKGSAFEWD